jgi:hypothetical protein
MKLSADALAVGCVSRCGARGEIAAVAERGGASQAARNARLLRDVLPTVPIRAADAEAGTARTGLM